MSSCSSPTLLDAIEDEGHKNVDILLQEEGEHIVVFLSGDKEDNRMISLNTYQKKRNGYIYSANGEYAKNIDHKMKEDYVTVSTVGNTQTLVLWGYVLNIPNADTLAYTLSDEDGSSIFESKAKFNENFVVLEHISPDEIDPNAFNQLSYKVLDKNGDVLIER